MNSVRNRWVSALLLGALVLATAAPARAQEERPLPRRMSPGPRARPEEVRRAVQEVVIARMREALHLTEEQEAKVLPRFTELMQTRTDHAMKRRAAQAPPPSPLLHRNPGDHGNAAPLRDAPALRLPGGHPDRARPPGRRGRRSAPPVPRLPHPGAPVQDPRRGDRLHRPGRRRNRLHRSEDAHVASLRVARRGSRSQKARPDRPDRRALSGAPPRPVPPPTPRPGSRRTRPSAFRATAGLTPSGTPCRISRHPVNQVRGLAA